MSDFSELDQIRPIARPGSTTRGRRHAGVFTRFRRSVNLWFWAIVGLPTLFAAVYYFAIASDLYMSEAMFIVRSPIKPATSSIAGALQSAGVSHGDEDTAAVEEYIGSRDAVRRLEQEQDLRAVFDRPEGDIITRFPGVLYWRKDFEALYKRYSHFVSADVNTGSGISTLEVKAYRPEDAQRIAAALLNYSEQLINDMNERARRDALKTFDQEVVSAQAKLEQIQGELTTYRINQNMLDPKTEAEGPLKLLAQLNTEEATAKDQLAEVQRNSPSSPQVNLIKTRIASLEHLIAEQRTKITGGSNSLASALKDYERLSIDQTIAEKLLASAVASRETARLEAQRQQLYLETITQPNLADYPLYPKRALSFVTVVVSCLTVYGIAWLLIASVREHVAA